MRPDAPSTLLRSHPAPVDDSPPEATSPPPTGRKTPRRNSTGDPGRHPADTRALPHGHGFPAVGPIRAPAAVRGNSATTAAPRSRPRPWPVPELIVAVLFARRLRGDDGLGAVLSSEVNQ
ncbi:hypothetical protein ACFWIQ_11430 [Kitasatospora sp. NPDC127059]|uniref:hypothetical protein n=1 Tax=unclassified Kitasatospora TaxID=2633591 RepID=UPI00365DDF87